MQTVRCNSSVQTLLTLTLLAALAGTPSEARPCGALLHAETADAAIDGQRALVVWRQDTVDVHVQLKVTGSADAAMWLLPVPTTPEMSVSSVEIFDALDQLSTPIIELESPSAGDSGGGCLGSSDAAGGVNQSGGADGVVFSEGGTVGSYDYEIVLAPTAAVVIEHLNGKGFDVPAAWETEIGSYVDQDMLFVAARLTDPVNTSTDALEPLVMTMPRPASSQMVYPLGIGRLSSSDVMPVRLYQLSDRRYRIVNYGSVSLDMLADRVRENWANDGDPTVATAFDQLTATSGGRLVVTEYAADITRLELPTVLADLVDDSAFYLTRSYARPTRDALEDMLLSFASDAPDEDGYAEAPATSTSSLPMLLLAVLGWLGLVARRRHRHDLERP